jgi:3-hydroxyisobutyrate dehydrogenase
MKRRACVIGLGSMGYGAAVSLLRAGFEVRGVDVRADVLDRFARDGGMPERTAAAGARDAEAALTFVVNAVQTEAVLFGEDGAAATMTPGAVVIACATVPPLEAERLAARIGERGLLALDAPVSGGPIKAAEGAVTVMASGAAAAFDKAQPFLDAIAAKVYRLGDKPGVGSRVKMVNQLLAGVHIAAAAEAMALGMRAGIDPKLLFEVISVSAGSSWMFQNRVPHILDGDYAPRSAVDIWPKDLGIVLETAKALGFPTPMAAAAHELFAKAAARGIGREDDAAVVKIYADNAGIELPKKTG